MVTKNTQQQPNTAIQTILYKSIQHSTTRNEAPTGWMVVWLLVIIGIFYFFYLLSEKLKLNNEFSTKHGRIIKIDKMMEEEVPVICNTLLQIK